MKLISVVKLATLPIILVSLLAVSLFCGLMIATAGVAIYPPLVSMTAPLVCGGEFTIESRRYSHYPGESVVTHTFYCREPGSDTKTDVSTNAVLVVFGVYSTLIFIVSSAAAIGIIGVFYFAISRYVRGLNQEQPTRLAG